MLKKIFSTKVTVGGLLIGILLFIWGSWIVKGVIHQYQYQSRMEIKEGVEKNVDEIEEKIKREMKKREKELEEALKNRERQAGLNRTTPMIRDM